MDARTAVKYFKGRSDFALGMARSFEGNPRVPELTQYWRGQAVAYMDAAKMLCDHEFGPLPVEDDICVVACIHCGVVQGGGD